MLNCLPPSKPKVLPDNASNFGIPAGTHGRNGHVPEIVVIHCVPFTLEEGREIFCRTFMPRSNARPRHYSPHWMVGNSCAIGSFVCPEDTAHGFPELIGQATPNLSNINWPIINSRPGVQPDLYALHIYIEGGREGPSNDPCLDRCPGFCGTPLNECAAKKLVHLLAWIHQTYNIPLNSNFIKFEQDFNAAAADECPCNNIQTLLGAAEQYCETPEYPEEPKLISSCDPVSIYGTDSLNRQVKISMACLFGSIASGSFGADFGACCTVNANATKIYVDTAGKLRGPPEHTVLSTSGAESRVVEAIPTPVAGSVTNAFEVELANTTCRTLAVDHRIYIGETAGVAGNGVVTTEYEYSIDGGAWVVIDRSAIVNPEAAQRTIHGPNRSIAFYEADLPCGQTRKLAVRARILDATAGSINYSTVLHTQLIGHTKAS